MSSQGESNGSGGPSPEAVTEWLRDKGEHSDVVISSRVRLARNLAGLPFANRATPAQRLRSFEACRDWILHAGLAGRVRWIDLHSAAAVERMWLVERHLISKQLSRGKSAPEVATTSGEEKGAKGGRGVVDPRGVAFTLPDERASIMVNEEDHLRIQVIRSGMALDEAWREADQIDDLIEAGIDYAFSARFGYLTACATNVGTGLRMSVMLHLPGLRLTGDIDRVRKAAADMNLAVRGFYGEGSEAVGDFYQISNQTTLGKRESEILGELAGEIIPRVVEYERVSRQSLLSKRRLGLEDQVFRALGVLTHARALATEEAMQLLSHVRLGLVCSVIKPGGAIDVQSINHLMLLVQPAHLQKIVGRTLDQEQRKEARAALVRARLGAAK